MLNEFSFLLEDDPTPARNNQVTRAASLVVSSLSFVRALRKKELPPDELRGTPLCMVRHPAYDDLRQNSEIFLVK